MMNEIYKRTDYIHLLLFSLISICAMKKSCLSSDIRSDVSIGRNDCYLVSDVSHSGEGFGHQQEGIQEVHNDVVDDVDVDVAVDDNVDHNDDDDDKDGHDDDVLGPAHCT